MTRKTDFKKDCKEWSYRKRFLEALLVSSLSENNFRLPTIEEFILSEVVNGTIEYVGGDAGQVDYQGSRLDRSTFEGRLHKYFESEMEAHSKGKLNPKIREAINKLCGCYYVDPTGPDRPYPHTELYDHFRGPFGGGICQVIGRSTFSLPHDTFIKVQEKVLSSLSSPEKKNIIGIGKAMRKYVNRDLEFIGKTYNW